MSLTVRVRPNDGGILVRVTGDLDIEDEASFQEILLHVMRAYGPRVLLDLAGVSFMDCAGLRALLITRSRAETRKGSVRLVAASTTVRRIIAVTGMGGVFPVRGYGGAATAATAVNWEGFRLMADLGQVYP